MWVAYIVRLTLKYHKKFLKKLSSDLFAPTQIIYSWELVELEWNGVNLLVFMKKADFVVNFMCKWDCKIARPWILYIAVVYTPGDFVFKKLRF